MIFRFFIHDVAPAEANLAKLDNAFIIISLNRCELILKVHAITFDILCSDSSRSPASTPSRPCLSRSWLFSLCETLY